MIFEYVYFKLYFFYNFFINIHICHIFIGVTTTNVNLVSRDICARPHTFLLETTRPAQPGDRDSLVMIRNGPETTIR